LSYRVKIDAFEGPFQLLLSLVSEQKIDISAISVSDIADQYLASIKGMEDLDMDVASDFLIVASTLLSLKALTLLPDEPSDDVYDEFDDLTPAQTCDILIARLCAYKQYKNASAALCSRMQTESRMHPRHVGPDPEFLGLLPDYLAGVTLRGLGVICADLACRRETFVLEAKHIAAKPIAVEACLRNISNRLATGRIKTFSELLDDDVTPPIFVVTFLAILEMYHRGMILIEQNEGEETITVVMLDRERWAPATGLDEATTRMTMNELPQELSVDVASSTSPTRAKELNDHV
jgi:segregation and condensation protein A